MILRRLAFVAVFPFLAVGCVALASAGQSRAAVAFPAPAAVPSSIAQPAVVADTGSPPPPTVPATAQQRHVERVVDGDTLVLDGSETVRLIGVDTPETKKPNTPVQCYGPEASARTAEIVAGGIVWIESDPTQARVDRYGRTLAYVYVAGGQTVEELLISGGYGHEYTYGEPYLLRDRFVAAQEDAAANARGLWAACDRGD